MQGWVNFYELIGGAAATLLGLLFVSVSLNAEAILGPAHRHSKRLAEQAFQNYICVLLISLEALFPDMRLISMGYSILYTTGLWCVWVVWRMYSVLAGPPSGESRFQSLRRYFSTFLGFAALVYAATRMVLRPSADDTTLVAIGVLLLLISATVVSWELLIKVAEERYAARED